MRPQVLLMKYIFVQRTWINSCKIIVKEFVLVPVELIMIIQQSNGIFQNKYF